MKGDDVNTGGGKIRFPISMKLITMISVIVLVSLLSVTIAATYFFRNDNKIRAMEDTLNYSTLISKKLNSDIRSIVERAKLAAIGLRGGPGRGEAGTFTRMLFSRDPGMIFIGIMAEGRNDPVKSMQNYSYFLSRDTLPDVKSIIRAEYGIISRSFSGEDTIFNPSYYFKEPVIGISIPLDPDSRGTAVLIFYSMDIILDSITMGSVINSYIVTGTGDLIAHRDRELVKSITNYSSEPVIKMMMTNPNQNAQTAFAGSDGERYLGAFSRIGFSDAAVISYVREDVAFAMVYKIQRIIMWLTGIVLAASFLINFFFSRSLSNPISRLIKASHEIEEGHYDIDIYSDSSDEIGVLADSFHHMAEGLAERERIKTAFGKFVNKQIAELVTNKEVKLGGERKKVTVFFSDIRSFTRISESLEPEQVVEFLNEYMTRMVRCINRNRGVVDKYIGDAIMAVWGAPVSTGRDPFFAINAALMMRDELIDFNKDRGTKEKPFIRIGCGIHCGPVLSGQIGSEDRMEYTVIGDTVNLASRIEALNKVFGTDILISEQTSWEIEKLFRLEPMRKIMVKGKGEPLQIFAVLGRKANNEAPKTIDELRRLLGTDNMNFAQGDDPLYLEKEEKYEVLD